MGEFGPASFAGEEKRGLRLLPGDHLCRAEQIKLHRGLVGMQVGQARALRMRVERIVQPLSLLSYPHGGHDAAVRGAAQAAGYGGAWTTEPGRNGAGTDPFCLRRIGVKAKDGPLAFMWKVLTGELRP